MRLGPYFVTSGLLAIGLVACGGAGESSGEPKASHDAGLSPVSTTDSGVAPDAAEPSTADDAGTASEDADIYGPNPTDGTPTRQACTPNFGSAITSSHGRLDGYLVAIVQPDTDKACNSDSHVHLQVSANGATYDVATNLETYFYPLDLALPNGAWSEGWHAGQPLNYTTLGLHSAQFSHPASEAALAAIVTEDLANANHVSVFATGYGPTGVHDIHYESGNNAGGIIIDPLSPTSHGLFFCFNTDTF